MLKWLLIVFLASITVAGCEIYHHGAYAGLGVGVILLPGLIALAWMVARLLLPKTTKDRDDSATYD